MTVSQHYVTFASPGTFFPEQTRKEIDSWDVQKAQEMAKTISERYGATPYGFYFSTRSRGPDDLDAKETAASPFHFVNCNILTLEDVIARNDPRDEILIRNMKNNGFDRIAEPKTGWKASLPVAKDAIVL